MNYGYDLNSTYCAELVSGSKYKFVQNFKKFAAFTLAEVLITLGIIGIVAALTIPTLLSKYEKKLIEVGAEKTFSELNNLIKMSEVDNGSFINWDYTLNNKDFINKYFRPYINLTECKSHNGKNNGKQPCFAGSDGNFYMWLEQPNRTMSTGGEDRVMPKYLLQDGRSIAINKTFDTGRNWKYVSFTIDVNGQRGKSVMGEDVFRFCLMNYKCSNQGCRELHAGTCVNGGSKNRPAGETLSRCTTYGETCGYYLESNNWKFPKNYPIKF